MKLLRPDSSQKKVQLVRLIIIKKKRKLMLGSMVSIKTMMVESLKMMPELTKSEFHISGYRL